MKRRLLVDGMAWVMLSALLCLGAVAVTIVSAGGVLALDWQPALGLHEPWRLWTCAWVHGSQAHLLVNLAGGAVVAFVGWRARVPTASAVAWFVAWPGTQLVMAAIDSERLGLVMPHYFGLSGVLHAGVAVLGLSLAWPATRAPARARAATHARAHVDSAHASPVESSDNASESSSMAGLRAPTSAPPSTLDSAPPRLPMPEAAPAQFATADPTPARRATPNPMPTPLDEPRPPRERWIGVAIVAGTLAKVVSEAPWDLAPRDSVALGIAVAPVAHACGLAAGLLAWAAMRLLARRQS